MNRPRRMFVFGDSWPAGHVTKEIVKEHERKYFRDKDGIATVVQTMEVEKDNVKNPFPTLISKMLSISVHNRGVSSHSNTAIVSDFWDYVINDYREGDFVLMCWTNWNRLTVRGDKMFRNGYSSDSFTNRFSSFTTGKMMTQDPEALEIHSELGDHVDTTDTLEDDYFKLLQSATAYHMFKNICNQKNIKHLQISSFCHDGFNNKIRPVWDRNDPDWIEVGSDYNTLIDIIMERWIKEGKKIEFKKWIRAVEHHNMEKGYRYFNKLDLHPNEEGHQLIAETLAPYIKKKLEE